MSYYITFDSSGGVTLSHYGILGQKWGVRRFQNADGTLTPAGKARLMRNLAKEDRKVEAYKNRKARSLTRKSNVNELQDRVTALKLSGRSTEARRYEAELESRKSALEKALKQLDSTTIEDVRADKAAKGRKAAKVVLGVLGGAFVTATGIRAKSLMTPITVRDSYSMNIGGQVSSWDNSYQLPAKYDNWAEAILKAWT